MRLSTFAEKALAILQGGAETTAELFDIFTSGYAESYKKLRRYRTAQISPHTRFANHPETIQFYSTLNHLKNQGFIQKTRSGGNKTRWHITARGDEKLKLLKARRVFAPSAILYRPLPDASLKIIAYDIPAREGRKQYWLRAALQQCGFRMLQKSVWVGKKKLPETFLRDLRERGMLSYVHIFSVGKEGTLRKLAKREG